MKILLSCMSMNFLSGSPLYFYEFARELKRLGHEVAIESVWEPALGDAAKLKTNLEAAGVLCLTKRNDYKPDVIFASQWNQLLSDEEAKRKFDAPIINIIHSEYDYETPYLGATKWVAIRPSIKDHLTREHGIGDDMIKVIYNGVDAARFNPSKRKVTDRDYSLTLVPCTLDGLRQPFLSFMAAQASPEHHIIFMGHDFGASFDRTKPGIMVVPDAFNVENYIGQVDRVAGILLGRINLEAAFMNVPSFIHDPNTGEQTGLVSAGYRGEWDIKTVTKQLLELV